MIVLFHTCFSSFDRSKNNTIIKQEYTGAREKMQNMHFFCIFFAKNLHMSKKSSTFAPAFEIEGTCAKKKRFLSAFEKEQ